MKIKNAIKLDKGVYIFEVIIKNEHVYIQYDFATQLGNLFTKLVPKNPQFTSIEIDNKIFEKVCRKVEDELADIIGLDKTPIPYEEKAFDASKTDFKALLSNSFVEADEFAEFVRICFTHKKNGIVYGPGGFGKSEMLRTILKECNLIKDTFILSFGEDMKEQILWGNYNMKKILNEGDVEYNVEQSFLNYKYVIFEELFDAPASVLLALKNTLQEKQLQKGVQTYDMKCISVIGLTNKEPNDLAKIGAHVDALLERFPLQMKQEWSNYNVENYRKLLQLRFSDEQFIKLDKLATLFAEVAKRKVISPRIALAAAEILLENMKSSSFEKSLPLLRYIKGFENYGEEVYKKLVEAEKLEKTKEKLAEFDRLKKKYMTDYSSASTDVAKKDSIGKLIKLSKDLNELYVDDELFEFKKALLIKVIDNVNDLKNRYFRDVCS